MLENPATETPKTPHEFHYWENKDQRWARTLRAVGKRVLGFDPEPADDLVDTIASMYYDADPVAEEFVKDVYLAKGMAQGRAMLDQAIDQGAASVEDAPESLITLFDDIENDPSWVDQDLVELGAQTFRRYGTSIFSFAGAITLAGYSESSVAKPLILTGAYAGGTAKNRFLETAAFWIAVSTAGGLRPGAAGRASALRVRIMHVFVRERLLSHPEWDQDAWGVPISQADALLTLMGGSFIPGYAMKAMGYRPTRREIEAMMHFWRYVGHLMGVRPRWYPASIEDGYQLMYVTLVKAANLSGDDGRELCRSFLQAFEPALEGSLLDRIRERWAHGIQRGYTRFFMPPWAYRKNKLPGVGLWALHPLMQFPFIFAAETARRRLPILDRVADRVAKGQRDRWFKRHMGDRPAEYKPAQKFTR